MVKEGGQDLYNGKYTTDEETVMMRSTSIISYLYQNAHAFQLTKLARFGFSSGGGSPR